jgi:DNA-binding NarL/FixJ family response regulator
MKPKVKKYLLTESDIEWILEALSEGYSKKQLAKQYKISVRQLNAELK